MHNAAPPTPTPLFGREGPLHACPYPSLAILWAPGNRLLQIIADYWAGPGPQIL